MHGRSDAPMRTPHDPRPTMSSTAARSRFSLALVAALCAGLPFAACRGPQPVEAPPEKEKSAEQLTLDKFQSLISQGALKPVKAMEDDAFAGAKPDMDEDVFAQAVARLEAERAARHAADGKEHKPADTPPTETAPTPAPAPAPAAAPDMATAFPENPYLVFGKRIQVYPESGLIMKPYPLKVGTGTLVAKLLTDYGNFPLYDPKAGPQTSDKVRIDLQPNMDVELMADLRAPMTTDGAQVHLADWLIITAGFERLREVQSFLDIFAAGVPQIEIEAKIVEVSTTDTLDVGVKPIDTTTPIFGFPDHTFVNQFNFNLPNTANFNNGDALLQLGAVQDGMHFNAILEMLATYQNVSINSRPKIAVREGARAEIVNTLKLPFYSVGSIGPDGKVAAGLAFEEVGVKLYVIPRVVGTRTVALNIDVEASQESGSATTFTLQNGQTISNPIIAKRGAKTVVYLEPGQAVILGGLIAERMAENVSKVPILGDIPLLGNLFRSTYKKKELTNVLFFIRPRILQGSDLHREF